MEDKNERENKLLLNFLKNIEKVRILIGITILATVFILMFLNISKINRYIKSYFILYIVLIQFIILFVYIFIALYNKIFYYLGKPVFSRLRKKLIEEIESNLGIKIKSTLAKINKKILNNSKLFKGSIKRVSIKKSFELVDNTGKSFIIEEIEAQMYGKYESKKIGTLIKSKVENDFNVKISGFTEKEVREKKYKIIKTTILFMCIIFLLCIYFECLTYECILMIFIMTLINITIDYFLQIYKMNNFYKQKLENNTEVYINSEINNSANTIEVLSKKIIEFDNFISISTYENNLFIFINKVQIFSYNRKKDYSLNYFKNELDEVKKIIEFVKEIK